jgi:hypothetical protein
MNRRNFIQSIGRGAILSGLVFTSAYLLLKEKPEGAGSCNLDFVCKNCKKVKNCNLPEANSYRKQDLKGNERKKF